MTNRIQARKCDLTILLPTYNEVAAVGNLLEEIRKEVRIPYQVVVADSTSTDGTISTCLDKGARVVSGLSRGKGNAFREVLYTLDTPYTIMMNADLTYPPAYVALLYRSLKLGADVVIGTRAIVEKGAMSHLHSFGNWGLSTLASILYGTKVVDLCTGMWGFKTSVLTSLPLTSTHFTLEADLLVNVVRQGYKLRQVPIAYRARLDGDKPKLRLIHGFQIAAFLVQSRVRRNKCRKYGK